MYVKGTDLMTLYLDQDPQDDLKGGGGVDEAYLQKYYNQAHRKDDETVTIARVSSQIGRNLQAQTNTASPPGINISPSKDPSITPGLTQEAAEDEDDSLIVRVYLALNPSRDNISLLGDEAYLTSEDVYPPGDESLCNSTTTRHTISLKVKHDTSIHAQDFNATLKKERESNTSVISEAENLKFGLV